MVPFGQSGPCVRFAQHIGRNKDGTFNELRLSPEKFLYLPRSRYDLTLERLHLAASPAIRKIQNQISTLEAHRTLPSLTSCFGTHSTPSSTHLDTSNVASIVTTQINAIESARCAPGHDRLPHPKHTLRGSSCWFSPRNLSGSKTSGLGYTSGSNNMNLHQTLDLR